MSLEKLPSLKDKIRAGREAKELEKSVPEVEVETEVEEEEVKSKKVKK